MRNVFYMSVGSFALGMISASDTFPKNMIIALCVLYFAFLIYKTAYRRNFKYGIAVVFLAVGFMSYSGIYNYKISGVKDFCGKNCDVYATVLSSDYGTNSVKYTAKLTKINSENKNLKIKESTRNSRKYLSIKDTDSSYLVYRFGANIVVFWNYKDNESKATFLDCIDSLQ